MTALPGSRLAHAAPAPGRADSLAAWLQWLDGGPRGRIALGLGRCRTVAARLGITRPAPTVVTVAGTNGKGSSVALLDSIWRAAGLRVATYTSPHLVRYNERVRIAGVEVGDVTLCAAFEAVERARGDVPLTYFEFGTLAALRIFQDAEPDVALLEVGLGGRLDAVNIIDADVALIATIGLDHEQWLGPTRERIAVEKAGIMRADRPAFCSDNDVPETVYEEAERIGARLGVLGSEFAFEDEDTDWTWWSGDTVLAGLPRPRLAGRHQLRNAAGALAVVHALGERHPVGAEALHAGLRDVVLHGRFHRLTGPGGIEYVMDVAHNPQALDTFRATLAMLPAAPRTHVLVGMLNTKNHVEYLRRLAGTADAWHFATLPGPQGASAERLSECLTAVQPGTSAACHADVASAHAAILASAAPGERVLVLGSFLTVGALLNELVATGSATV